MRSGKKRSVREREMRMGYVFVAPWIIGFVLFFLFPLAFSLVLSFSHVTNLQNFTLEAVGWKNYLDALLVDVDFVPKLLSSLLDALVKTPIIVVFSLLIAILLDRNIPLKGVYRALFLLPVVIGSGVVLETIQGNGATFSFTPQSVSMQQTTQAITTVDVGSIEMSARLTMLLGEKMASVVEVMLDYISQSLWMSGIQIILFLGALQSVPDTYYEAAVCDGATGWEKFWKITLPMVTPTILIVVVYTLISYFTSADNAVMVYVVDTSFTSLKLDYGSAMSWIYFLLIGLALGIVFAVSRRMTFYADDR